MGCDLGLFWFRFSSRFISIHAPIVGCDVKYCWVLTQEQRFQSTHPSWGATTTHWTHTPIIWISIHAPIVGCDKTSGVSANEYMISIHAPIVGCDINILVFGVLSVDFNPRTHRGVRHTPRLLCHRSFEFQSTHPSWGATLFTFYIGTRNNDFNPRTHRGVRPMYALHGSYRLQISIHAPIVGCD